MKTCKLCHRADMATARIRQKERIARRKERPNRHKVSIGDTFLAKTKEHLHARNMIGKRGFAGQVIGEFICTAAARSVIHAGSRQFNVDMFEYEVVTE